MRKNKMKREGRGRSKANPFEVGRPLPPRATSTTERNLPRRPASWALIAARFSTGPLNLRSTGNTKFALALQQNCTTNDPTRRSTKLSLRSISGWASFERKQQWRNNTDTLIENHLPTQIENKGRWKQRRGKGEETNTKINRSRFVKQRRVKEKERKEGIFAVSTANDTSCTMYDVF